MLSRNAKSRTAAANVAGQALVRGFSSEFKVRSRNPRRGSCFYGLCLPSPRLSARRRVSRKWDHAIRQVRREGQGKTSKFYSPQR